jgi:hypothetical protein
VRAIGAPSPLPRVSTPDDVVAARALETEPSLVSISAHLLAVARL